MSKSAGVFQFYLRKVALIVARLILVHPFRASRQRHRGNVLESWARETNAKLGNLFNVRVLSFDIYDVFETGPKRLERTSQTLQRNIQGLRENKASPLYYRSGVEARAESFVRADFKGKPSSVIFVAHSLGAWVVKSLGSLPELLGCIFVDTRVPRTNGDYDQYIADLAELVAFQSMKGSVRTSISGNLKQIDTSVSAHSVQHLAKTPSHGNFSRVLEAGTVPFAVWMSPEPGDPALKVSCCPGWQNYSDKRQTSRLVGRGRGTRSVIASLPGPRLSPKRANTTQEGSVLSAEEISQLDLALKAIISDESASERERTKELAASFFQIGEFRNAQRLYTVLERQQPGLDQNQFLEVQLRLAQTFMYTGEYTEARNRLQEINSQVELIQPGPLTRFNGYNANRLRLQVERWLAVSAIALGNYQGAVKRLEDLQLSCDRIAVSDLEFAILRVEISTDLALATALLGQYSRADKSLAAAEYDLDQVRILRDKVKDKDKAECSHISITSPALNLVQANVEMLRGRYSKALKIAISARESFEKLLGRRHYHTLESLGIVARVLTYKSQYKDARILCDELIEDMSRELGRSHPLTLAVMENLVQILRSQSRFEEALESAKAIRNLTEDSLGRVHPQTLRIKSQVAATHFDLGNYRIAEEMMEHLNPIASQCLGKANPDTLRYLVLTAFVLNKSQESGRTALKLTFKALEEQRFPQPGSELMSPENDLVVRGSVMQPPASPSVETAGSSGDRGQQALEEQRVTAVLEELSEEGDNKICVHPDILSTLEAISFIINQHAAELLGTVQPEYILDVVALHRRRTLHAQHLDTLVSEFHLAVISRDSGFSTDGVEYASVALYDVWQRLSEKFGSSHPRTLIAERELITTDCIRGKWHRGGPAKRRREWDWQFVNKNLLQATPSSSHAAQDYFQPILSHEISEDAQRRALWDLLDVEEVSREVLELLEPQLGPLHPEVLSTLLWLFTVQVHLTTALGQFDPVEIFIDAHETQRLLEERSRIPIVKEERPVEASRLQQSLFKLSAELDDKSVPIDLVSPFISMHGTQD